MRRSRTLIRQIWRCLSTVSLSLTTVAVSASSTLAAGPPWGAIVSQSKKGGGTSTPEPASWALLATGIGGIGWLLRKRRRK